MRRRPKHWDWRKSERRPSPAAPPGAFRHSSRFRSPNHLRFVLEQVFTRALDTPSPILLRKEMAQVIRDRFRISGGFKWQAGRIAAITASRTVPCECRPPRLDNRIRPLPNGGSGAGALPPPRRQKGRKSNCLTFPLMRRIEAHRKGFPCECPYIDRRIAHASRPIREPHKHRLTQNRKSHTKL